MSGSRGSDPTPFSHPLRSGGRLPCRTSPPDPDCSVTTGPRPEEGLRDYRSKVSLCRTDRDKEEEGFIGLAKPAVPETVSDLK